ncbi:MAG: hypothetical protein NZM43_07955 [Saprospiraceae bacterium]|nr:hypothetical protein [Saprospiraceae bacterium]MDW8484241.1 hypothetical protein [Saprospiraceae bacterium]
MSSLLDKINIDYLAAKHAQAVATCKDIENTATKALGVLQENGVYACFLYLFAKEKENGRKLSEKMCALLKAIGLGVPPDDTADAQKVLKFVNEDIAQNLERLLLAKETLEQMLIYVRYGAKAGSESNPKKSTEAER